MTQKKAHLWVISHLCVSVLSPGLWGRKLQVSFWGHREGPRRQGQPHRADTRRAGESLLLIPPDCCCQTTLKTYTSLYISNAFPNLRNYCVLHICFKLSEACMMYGWIKDLMFMWVDMFVWETWSQILKKLKGIVWHFGKYRYPMSCWDLEGKTDTVLTCEL